MMTSHDPTLGSTEAIEGELGLPSGLLVKLLMDGDDWTFVIRAHALVESAVNHLLVAALREVRLASVIAQMELSNARAGKLAIVEALDLLPKPHRRFIRGFSELRNTLVHDATNVGFSFAMHLGVMNADQRKSFDNTFGGIFTSAKAPPNETFQRVTSDNPRVLVWSSVLIVVSLCYSAKLRATIDKRLEDLGRQIAQEDAEMSAIARSLLSSILSGLEKRGEFVIRLGKEGKSTSRDT